MDDGSALCCISFIGSLFNDVIMYVVCIFCKPYNLNLFKPLLTASYNNRSVYIVFDTSLHCCFGSLSLILSNYQNVIENLESKLRGQSEYRGLRRTAEESVENHKTITEEPLKSHWRTTRGLYKRTAEEPLENHSY